MVYSDRIDVPEETDINKTNESKECDVCHCWYFLEIFLSLKRMFIVVAKIY